MIYHHLKAHGNQSLSELVEYFLRPERKIREIIEQEIAHGALIGSKSNDGGGYYAIETQEQFERAIGELMSRVDKLCQKKDMLFRSWRDRDMLKLPFPKTDMVDLADQTVRDEKIAGGL